MEWRRHSTTFVPLYYNNNNNKSSRGVGEVAPLYGVDSVLVLTNPGVQ